MWYCCTTDRGSNETQARKHILRLTSDLDNVVFLDSDCFEHQVHLAVLGGLVLTDEALRSHGRSFKYYSTIAIFSACARELSNEIFATWINLYNAEDALKFAKTLVPKSNAGRWGCVDSIEQRLLGPPFDRWATVLNHVILRKLNLNAAELQSFSGLLPNDLLLLFMPKDTKTTARAGTAKAKAKSGAAKAKASSNAGSSGGAQAAGAEKVDTLAIEQLAEYTRRIGKWRRQLLLTVNDALFSRLVRVVNTARKPLQHTSHYLKQDGGCKLLDLVCWKAESIRAEFDKLLSGSSLAVSRVKRGGMQDDFRAHTQKKTQQCSRVHSQGLDPEIGCGAGFQGPTKATQRGKAAASVLAPKMLTL